MTSLYALTTEAQALQTQIAALAEQLHDDDTDATTEALEALLLEEEHNKEALLAKADSYCWVIDQLRAQGRARSDQARRLAELADADQRKADALEDRLLTVLTRLQPDATRFSLPSHEISSRKNPPRVEVLDPEALPDAYWRTPEPKEPKPVPDLTAIKEALKAGKDVAGAVLVQERAWRIN